MDVIIYFVNFIEVWIIGNNEFIKLIRFYFNIKFLVYYVMLW